MAGVPGEARVTWGHGPSQRCPWELFLPPPQLHYELICRLDLPSSTVCWVLAFV